MVGRKVIISNKCVNGDLNRIFLFCFLPSNRCPDFVKRKTYVKLVDDVREAGGDVKVFSTMHVSGERGF